MPNVFCKYPGDDRVHVIKFPKDDATCQKNPTGELGHVYAAKPDARPGYGEITPDKFCRDCGADKAR
jgi:hypothetical protein